MRVELTLIENLQLSTYLIVDQSLGSCIFSCGKGTSEGLSSVPSFTQLGSGYKILLIACSILWPLVTLAAVAHASTGLVSPTSEESTAFSPVFFRAVWTWALTHPCLEG